LQRSYLPPVSEKDLLTVELLQKAFGGHRRWASIYPFWDGSEQQNISQGLTIQVNSRSWAGATQVGLSGPGVRHLVRAEHYRDL